VEEDSETAAKLKAFDWPDNFEDLRRNARQILAYIEHDGNVSAAARALGVRRQSLAERLERIGLR
jgi:DNA-binding PucR family transcriptional regulator